MITRIETNLKENKLFNVENDLSVYPLHDNEFELLICYPDIEYQTLLGFGGAITESVGYVLSRS